MTTLKARPDTLVVACFRDLETFGITALTGEACAYSQRLLCDVNEDGLALLTDFFGIPNLQLAPPMNSRVNDCPSVGSLMLVPGLWKDIAKFAFFQSRALGYVDNPTGELVGLYTQDMLDRYVEHDYPVHRNYSLASTMPSVGSRNIHQMTGRVM